MLQILRTPTTPANAAGFHGAISHSAPASTNVVASPSASSSLSVSLLLSASQTGALYEAIRFFVRSPRPLSVTLASCLPPCRFSIVFSLMSPHLIDSLVGGHSLLVSVERKKRVVFGLISFQSRTIPCHCSVCLTDEWPREQNRVYFASLLTPLVLFSGWISLGQFSPKRLFSHLLSAIHHSCNVIIRCWCCAFSCSPSRLPRFALYLHGNRRVFVGSTLLLSLHFCNPSVLPLKSSAEQTNRVLFVDAGTAD